MIGMYQHEEYQYCCCCGWTIKWRFPMEAFVKDGESSGIGRFVGLDKETGQVACQLWFVSPGFKIAFGDEYSAQIDPERKEIYIIKST